MLSSVNVVNLFLDIPAKSIIESLDKSGLSLSNSGGKISELHSVVRASSFLAYFRELVFCYPEFSNVSKGFYEFIFEFLEAVEDFFNGF